MEFHGVDIICPRCRGDLYEERGGDSLCCYTCDHRYPVVLGIPDLRVFSDPYVDPHSDRRKGLALAARCAEMSFDEAVAAYYEQAEKVPPAQAKLFRHSLAVAPARSRASLEEWARRSEGSRPKASLRLLDLGCGTAPLLLAAKSRYKQVVGVDVAFRWLVMARKRLDEAGIDAPLLCACAEALPFSDDAFDHVAAESVLEHVRDQQASLAECRRVLGSDGRLFVTTPNRLCPGPDPHVGVWTGSLWPRAAIDAYVLRRGGNPPRRTLLSARSLRRRLRTAAFDPLTVYLPDVPAAQVQQLTGVKRILVSVYQRIKNTLGIRQAMLWIGPVLGAVAKPGHYEDRADAPSNRDTGRVRHETGETLCT